MTKKQYSIQTGLILIILGVLVFGTIQGSISGGDFVGYIKAGEFVLEDRFLYEYYLNTWPPLFSIFCVPLALVDDFSPFLIRLVWLLGCFAALLYTVKLTVETVFKRPVSLKTRPERVSILAQDPLIVAPFLIMLRFSLDNFANVQINIFMLLCCLLSVVYFIRGKYFWVGFWLGLSISIKIYPIFLLFYFLFKREFKPVLWSFLFILGFNAISFLVWDFDQTIHYYTHWATEVAPLSYIPHHKNQSLFGALLRFCTAEDIGMRLQVNWFSWEPRKVKLLTYAVVGLAALLPAFLFRKKLEKKDGLSAFLEYSFILTAIPLLSPVSWKAYFIFLWVPYFLLFALLFRCPTSLSKGKLRGLRIGFWTSILLTVFSTELTAGPYFSDVLEAYSAIAIGTVLLLIMQIYVYTHRDKFAFDSIEFREYR